MREAHLEWCRETRDIGLIPEPIFDEMKRPEGKFEKTADPVFIKLTGSKEEGGAVTIACSTQGASIAWRIGGDPEEPYGLESLRETRTDRSPERSCTRRPAGSGSATAASPRSSWAIPWWPSRRRRMRSQWEENPDLPGLRQRLMKLKELDFRGRTRRTPIWPYLKDPKPSVRYWAVVGLHASTKYPVDLALAKPAVTTMLEDPSIVVRVAAAHAMCDWGEERIALPVLVEALKNPTDKTRMFAMVALDKIGEKARPALPLIEAATKDSDDYVTRVAKTVLERLRAK